MKENIKKILFLSSVLFSIVIIFLTVFVFINVSSTVELRDSKENIKELEVYKKEVLKVKNNECRNEINNIIKYYEETSYDGDVSIKEMFDYGFEHSLLEYYSKVKDSCNISNDEADDNRLATKFLTASIQFDEIYQSYYYQYELGLKDYLIRDISEPSLNMVEYKINRSIILEIIDFLIKREVK